MLPALLSFLTFAPAPVSLDSVTLERARSLSDRLVVATFIAGEPYHYPEFGITDVGARARDDGAERVAVLRGKRYDVKAGERICVVGVLRVIDHKPAFVGRVLVPAWTEVRVEEVR